MSISKHVPGDQLAPKQTPREELHQSVDKLIQRQRLRLYRDESNKVEYHVIPSLWEQLAVSSSWRGGVAGGGAFGSRPVIATGVVSLANEITLFVLKGTSEHCGKTHTPSYKHAEAEAAADRAWKQAEIRQLEYQMVLGHDVSGCVTDDDKSQYAAELEDAHAQWIAAVGMWEPLNDRAEQKSKSLIPDSLRALAANITDPLDIAWWKETILDWCAQIAENLSLNLVRPQYLGETPCPDCHAATYATTRREDRKVEKLQVPALAITWDSPDTDGSSYQPPEKYHITKIRCQVCNQHWERGPALDSLVDLTIRRRGLKHKLLQKLAGMDVA